METQGIVLSAAEKRFQCWMWISVAMYGLGLPLFLLLGGQIAAFLGGLPGTLFQWPPWPAAGTGAAVAFWQVLGISLMSILCVLCWHIARDVRRYGPMITALLAAKLTSTLCYFGLFVWTWNWAFLTGMLTDGGIFAISWTLWFLASPGDAFLDSWERRVLATLGDTLLPRGGPFPKGYADVSDACLREADRFLAVQSPLERVMTRIMLRTLDVLPLLTGWFHCFKGLSESGRVAFFEQLEQSRLSPLRMMAVALKLYVVTPFYAVPDVEGPVEEQ